MNSPSNHVPPSETLTIVTWNILHDVTRTKAGTVLHQDVRAPSLASTLLDLRGQLQTDLDAVALQEVHKSDKQHTGEYIAQTLGYGIGEWVQHNEIPKDNPASKKGRKEEYVGLFGARIDHSDTIELGDNRRAVISRIGNTAIVGIHTRARIRNSELRVEQVQAVLDEVKDFPSVAFMGDFNSWLGSAPRKAIEAEEFKSVFTVLGEPHPKTYPSPAYRKIMYGDARFVAPSVTLDEIYVRGLGVAAADSFVGASDHVGLWAKVYEL